MTTPTKWAPVVPAPASFTPPGWDDDVHNEASPAATTSRAADPSPSRGSRLMVAGLIVLALVGVVMIYLAVAGSSEVLDAPIPPADIAVASTAPVVGPDGTEPVDTHEVSVVPVMTVADMAPMTYFVPSLGSYSQIVATDEFGESRFADFDTLAIPEDPSHSAWFSGGGALSDNGAGSTGTTLLASHVTGQGGWGVLHDLYTLTGGEVVYTKDAAGELAAWKITELTTHDHTDFPQEYWSADGVRQLVLVTCGQYDKAQKQFTKNIFATAVPVDVTTLEPLLY